MSNNGVNRAKNGVSSLADTQQAQDNAITCGFTAKSGNGVERNENGVTCRILWDSEWGYYCTHCLATFGREYREIKDMGSCPKCGAEVYEGVSRPLTLGESRMEAYR